MKLGIYGGTFNPPHLGHLAAAQFALDALNLDRLEFVPAAAPPHKTLPEGGPSAEQRLEMVELAADGLLLPKKVSVSGMELHRPGKSYTADTLEQLQAADPEAELWLLMGTDMFLTLQNWREPEVITRLAGICTFARTQSDSGELLETQARYLQETFGARTCVLQLPHIVDVSSTQLRELLAQGRGQEYLSPAVYGYIIRQGLYGVHYDLKQLPDRELRACSYSMIRAKRIAHVQGTEEEAVRLARRWGADEEKARRGAILHDCTKYLTMEEQLQLCRKYGIVLDDLEQQAVKLLHAKTGACVARDVYGVSDDVYEAIFWHTTGKADMTLLEKILYIADYMEPNRDFPGVERLRTLAYQDLDQAVLAGCEMSIQEMKDRGLPVHTNTVRARDWLRSKSSGKEP
ncbi:nicotinate (nicotinamide) nucleotide adenylyltransferase [Flavonifractor sp. An306]|uniref:nicotinate (nicotinamide) nucleotide adenylyltransferase n=1 Tax=Flavonifractor sp. An306 TaxID=1965629 RepID=UPI00174999F8|nr:nicotinate (nicotinamide) nucleotide adenylyltransferase [Flavonifractor sp. An306]